MKYKELQIIKHSLQHYLNRPNATQKEIEEENRLLDKVTKQVDEMKEKYDIKKSDETWVKANPVRLLFEGPDECAIDLRGRLIGYTAENCTNCGRLRVELWENGDAICEKCHWNQDKECYELDC